MKHAWLVVISTILISGCAIKTPPFPVSQFPIAERAVYYQETLPYRVAVLPLVDRRPKHEQLGQKAPARFFLLWNSRSGDYYTGDQLFGSEVPAQLSKQTAEYLRSANTFAKVFEPASLPNTPSWQDSSGLTQLAKAEVIDFFIAGEIEHFFGSQKQKASMYAVPLYFISAFGWQNSKSLPWGKTVIRFKLLNAKGGDVIWSEELQGSVTLPKETDSMAQAAMESFLLVSKDLAVKLRQLPLDSQMQP